MKGEAVNPFNVTKAVDFSDQQINDFWVDIQESGGFKKVAKPLSPMSMLILGGKGSGKTHLMRYFSYPLQKIRSSGGAIDGIRADRYVGIYMRCGGLNSGRFQNKGQTQEAWAAIFSYYMDLWLAQVVLAIVLDAFGPADELREAEEIICADAWDLFESPPSSHPPRTLRDLADAFRDLQKELDHAINNCAITGELKIDVRATRGKLVFGIPQILERRLASLRDCLFVFLIDELENLSEEQQKYINTLIREKELPCSFKIGARLYGVKTFRTYSADEDNKEGSEFESVRLDELLRGNKKYGLFARRLLVRRLCEHGYLSDSQPGQDALVESLDKWFEEFPQSKYAQAETAFVGDLYTEGRERPYFVALRRELKAGIGGRAAAGVASEADVTQIVDHLRCPDYPLLEKLNIFLLYRSWAGRKNLLQSAKAIGEDCDSEVKGTGRPKQYRLSLEHFKFDLLAQLRRDCGQQQVYCGLETFIVMSMGVPRNLLILLRHIISWAMFNGERPFKDRRLPITKKSQLAGVLEGSEWFFGDARMIGADGRDALDAVERLGTLMRTIRFSDKPVECSCTSFSCDVPESSDRARHVIDVAQKWSLLINVGHRQDKILDRRDMHLQLNLMLSPKWDLAIRRRGALSLKPDEVNAVFGGATQEVYRAVLANRTITVMAPFRKSGKDEAAQATLWPDAND
jgi:hypothetical protein